MHRTPLTTETRSTSERDGLNSSRSPHLNITTSKPIRVPSSTGAKITSLGVKTILMDLEVVVAVEEDSTRPTKIMTTRLKTKFIPSPHVDQAEAGMETQQEVAVEDTNREETRILSLTIRTRSVSQTTSPQRTVTGASSSAVFHTLLTTAKSESSSLTLG